MNIYQSDCTISQPTTRCEGSGRFTPLQPWAPALPVWVTWAAGHALASRVPCDQRGDELCLRGIDDSVL